MFSQSTQNIKNCISKFKNLLFVILIFCTYFNLNFANAQDLIIRNINGGKDTIDMGICHISDTLRTQFIFENKSNSNYYVPLSSDFQRYFLGKSKFDNSFPPYLFGEFTLSNSSKPFDLKANSTNMIEFWLVPESNFKLGKKIADLWISIVDKQSNKVVFATDTMLLVARLTDKLIAAYEENLKFDTVVIGSNAKIFQKWHLKNVSKKDMFISKAKFNLVSSKTTFEDEFIFQAIDSNSVLTTASKSTDIDFYYSPQDLGFDTAYYQIDYFKNQNQVPPKYDSLDFAYAFLSGFGAKIEVNSAKLLSNQILYNGAFLQADTIDIGMIKIEAKDTIRLILKNNSNINLGIEKIQEINSNLIESKSNKSNFHNIEKDGYDTLEIEITPKNVGNFTELLYLKTNIDKRKIYAWKQNQLYIPIVIKGKVAQAKVQISNTLVDFGNVSRSEDCVNELVKKINVKNSGNVDLLIKNIMLIDKDGVFDYTGNEDLIKPDSTNTIDIKFAPNSNKKFDGTIVLITNAGKPNDSLVINLSGSGVQQAAINVKIDSIFARPGTVINLPIKVNKDLIKFCSMFEDTLFFNPTILEYIGFSISNSAIDVISDDAVSLVSSSSLKLKLRRISNSYFLESDTLINLRFATYLGNATFSNIAFTSPKIGNENCESIFQALVKNGVVISDSVCGLDYKLLHNQSFTINSAFQKESILEVSIKSKIDNDLIFEIIDILGQKRFLGTSLTKARTDDNFTFDLSQLSDGIYTIIVKSKLNNEIQNSKILIIK